MRTITVCIALCVLGLPLFGAQQCDSGVTFSGPIVISKGGTYTGNWQSTDLKVPAVFVFTTDPVIITNSRLKAPGDIVQAFGTGTNVTVQRSCFLGLDSSDPTQVKGNAIHFFQPANVVVDHCDFENTGQFGVWVQRYAGDHTAHNSIRIVNNRFHNINAHYACDPTNLYCGGGISLNNVHGVPGVDIGWNQFIDEPYVSNVGDRINIYESSGTPDSPMQVHDNYMQGGYADDPAKNAGYFGSAITTDGASETDPAIATSYVKIHDNQAVGFTNVGFSIALGHDNEMYGNRAVTSGWLSNGVVFATTGNGIQHINYINDPPGVFGNNSVHDNFSGYRRFQNGAWGRADYYFGAPPAVAYNNQSFTPATADRPTVADELNEWVLWNKKVAANGVTIGSNFVHPQSGWWWDPNLSGTGFFIEYGGKSTTGMFVGGFLYDAAGSDTWLVSSGPLTGSTYTNNWLKVAGGQTLLGPYKPPSLQSSGSLTIAFSDTSHAVMTRPDGTQVSLQRFSFTAPPTPAAPLAGAPQSGWWWAGSAFSGTGYGIEIQGNAVFIVAYVYDDAGNPVWYLATGSLTTPASYSGTWDVYVGGPQLTSPEGTYSATKVAGKSVAMSLTFSDATHGTLTMGSVTIPIVRFQEF